MARGRIVDQKKVIARRIKEGRGQGQGEYYLPWLRVQDGGSLGFLCRPPGWTTGRTHHLLSKHERNYFYILDWASCVVDIREQYPLLPLDRTLEIAERLRIKHPTDPHSKEPVVMTSDFLIDWITDDGVIQKIRTVKPSDQLEFNRVIEKFEIERTFWEEQNFDWGIVTEQEIKEQKILTGNVMSVHRKWWFDDLPAQTQNHFAHIEEALYDRICKKGMTPAIAAQQVDGLLRLPPGCSLTALRHLLARKVWKVDMNTPFAFDKSMEFERTDGGLYVSSLAS